MAVILGLPKGSLEEATFNMMRKAGFNVSCRSRSYMPSIDDPTIQCRLIRPQEISRYIELGLLDAGITGFDWIYENGSDVIEVSEMCYSKATPNPVRWVLAVPNDSPIKSVKDLKGKRIATEAVGLTKRYLSQHGVTAEVEFSWGATEVKAPELVDAIVELTETGSSLRANNLRIVDTILTSTPRFIANKKAWDDPEKRKKIEQIALLLQGAQAAESRVLIKLNVAEKNLESVVKLLPALHSPTINKIFGDDNWYAIESVVPDKIVRDIIPQMREAGATGIIELPLNKVIF